VGKKQQRLSGGRATRQLPKVGQVVNPRAGLLGQRAVFKTELPHLVGGGDNQTVAALGKHSCCMLKTTTALTTLHKLAELLQFSIATCSVDIRSQILLTRQSPGGTTSELLLVQKIPGLDT
jgi:hypothetical protein